MTPDLFFKEKTVRKFCRAFRLCKIMCINNAQPMRKYFVVVGISTYVTKIPTVCSTQTMICTTNFLSSIQACHTFFLHNHLNVL